MLQGIHDRAQGWIAWIIFGFIIMTFALFGIQEYFDINEQPAVATVDDTKITQRDFQRALQRQRQNFQSILGANYDPKMFDSPVVKQNIVEDLVNDALLMSAIQDNKLRISERQIGQLIASIPQFQRDGVFSEQLFNAYLAGEGATQESFFNRLASDLLHKQFYQGMVNSGISTPAERLYQTRLLEQSRDISFIQFNYKDGLNKVSVAADEVAEYYKANPQQFMSQEKVALEYIDLSLNSIAREMTATEKQLRDYYARSKSQYVAAEQRRASHILLQLAPNAAAAEIQAAEKKAAEITGALASGGDFAALAKQYSTDIGSAKNGGDIGFVVADSGLPKAFVDSVFALSEGQVSKPVRTESGLHIIKLTKIKREQKSFEQVKAQLEKDYKLHEAEGTYFKLAEDLVNLANEQPEALQPIASELGLKLLTTGLFARNEAKGIIADPKVLPVAFDKELISSRYNSDAIELGQEHIVLLRVKEHQPAVVRPFAEVKAGIAEQLKKQKAIEYAATQAEAARKQLEQGDTPAKVAAAHGVKWLSNKAIKRSDVAKLDANLVAELFRLPKSDAGVYATVQTRNGDYAVITATKVNEGSQPVEAEAQIRRAYDENGGLLYNQYVQNLKLGADITYHYDLLN